MMQELSRTNDESARIAALDACGLLDTGADPAFDAFVELAAQICDAPIALVSLVDTTRQYIKASVGLAGLTEIPREVGFCAHGIESCDMLEVRDARLDPRFADNPVVAGEPYLRFYAGAPIVDRDGIVLGMLCVHDFRPRDLTDVQRAALRRLARSLEIVIDARRGVPEKNLAQLALLSTALENIANPVVVLAIGRDGSPNTIAYVNRAFVGHFGYEAADVIGQRMITFAGPLTDMDVFERFRAAILDGVPLRDTLTLYTSVGSPRLVEIADRPLSATHRILSLTDLTEIRATHDALANANERLGSLLANNMEAVLTVDVDGRCLDVNAAAESLLGYAREELLGNGLDTTIAGVFPESVAFPEAIRRDGTLEFSAVYRHRSGRLLDVECRAVPMMVKGRTEGAYVFARDVTEANRLARLVAEQAQRTRALYLISAAKGTTDAKQIDAALELVLDAFEMQYSFMFRLDGNTVHLLNVVGQGMVMVGTEFELEETRAKEAIKIDDVYTVDDMSSPDGHCEGVPDYPDWHAYVSVPLHVDGKIWGAIGFCSRHVVRFNDYDRDFVRLVAALVSSALERQIQGKRLDDLAYLDTLTGLPNRAKLMDEIAVALSAARRRRRSFALHFIDLDGFKGVNDRAGHGVGDLALKEVALRLRGLARLHDLPARFGGDEFVLLQSDLVKPADAEALGWRIVAALSQPYELGGQTFDLGASIGIAIYPEDGFDERDLLHNADVALYRAKARGKNGVQIGGKRAAGERLIGLTS